MLGLDALQLDGDFLARDDVGACVLSAIVKSGGPLVRTEIDVTKGAASNLAANSVLVADTEILLQSASCLYWVTVSGVDAYHCRHAC